LLRNTTVGTKEDGCYVSGVVIALQDENDCYIDYLATLGVFSVSIRNACLMTDQQRMLTPPWHLILPSHLSEVRDALHSIL
jgi:hypothetical protein